MLALLDTQREVPQHGRLAADDGNAAQVEQGGTDSGHETVMLRRAANGADGQATRARNRTGSIASPRLKWPAAR